MIRKFKMDNFNQYKKHRILILKGTRTQNEYVDNDDMYIQVNPFAKHLRKLHEHIPIPFKEIWYANWKKRIREYDVIIIFDALRGRDIIQYIHKANPFARIIIYYINKFKQGARNDLGHFRELPCELWSFDKNDCERAGMKFNHFCYEDAFYEENKDAFYNKENAGPILYDAFFIGVDKNRLPTLIRLKALMEKYHYRTKIIIKKDNHGSYKHLSDEEKSILIEKSIQYKDIIKYIHQSKSIIEIQYSDQNGLTLRAMESLFFKKKLITDNLDIINYDFYKRENIFLLGQDPEKCLETFLSSPYEPVDDDIIKQYTWEAWLERFFQ